MPRIIAYIAEPTKRLAKKGEFVDAAYDGGIYRLTSDSAAPRTVFHPVHEGTPVPEGSEVHRVVGQFFEKLGVVVNPPQTAPGSEYTGQDLPGGPG